MRQDPEPDRSSAAQGELRQAARRPWDVLIIGSGIGGATLGQALARSGWRVLFLEQGRDLRGADAWHHWPEEHPDYEHGSVARRMEIRQRAGWETNVFESPQGPFVPDTGRGTGGSSALYGMVMERFFPSDFAPRANHRPNDRASLPEAWPLCYEDLRPWYRQAEALFGVRGGVDPLRRHRLARQPGPADNGTAQLTGQLEARGLRPYRLPLAQAGDPGCRCCQSVLCDHACKADALSICLDPALRLPEVQLLSECTALELKTTGRSITSVLCERRGERAELSAPIVVLAAGALATPRLLLGSRSGSFPSGVANGSGMVGRHVMRHCIDLWVLRRGPRTQSPMDAKSLGFSDLYEVDQERLGTVQSFGPPAPLAVLRQRPGLNPWRLMGPLAPLAWRRFNDRPILASILEDLPYPDNQVSLTANGQPRLRYRLGRSELRRRGVMRSQLRRRLRGLGATRPPGGEPFEALGHVCGTCRAGTSPQDSVLDGTNRAWEVDNLYVVDASFFPSSAGINPALTVAANALRVAEHLCERGR